MNQLPKIAADSSDRERVATEAERDSVDMKTAEYMVQYIGEEFPAIIAGVTAFGFFVELENGVEGLVHITALEDDYYRYVEDQHCLLGERLKKRYRLGDAVTVRLMRANPAERTLDFSLVPGPGQAKPTQKSSSGKAKSTQKRSQPQAPPEQKSRRKKTEVKPSAGKKSKHKDRRRKS